MESDAEFVDRLDLSGLPIRDRERLRALARRGAAVQDLPSKIREAAENSPYAEGVSPSYRRGLFVGYEAAAQIVEGALTPSQEKQNGK